MIVRAPLVSFVVIAFGISWAIWTPLVARTSLSREALWIIYYAGVIGPAIAAVVCARSSAEWESLLRRVTLWRVTPAWCASATLLPFAIRSVAVSGVVLWKHEHVVFRSWYSIVTITALMVLLVPFEETGWRGYALPVLQRKHSPARASLIVGGMWALWHLPLMWASVGYQRTERPWVYMWWFVVTIIPVSCIATWLFNRTSDSLVVVSLFHVCVNVADFVLILPATTGQAALLSTSVITTAVVVVIYRIDQLGAARRRLTPS